MKFQVCMVAFVLAASALVPVTAVAASEEEGAVEVALEAGGSADEAGRPARAWWLRYPAWLFLGLLAGFGMGQLINKRLGGLGCLVPIWGLAVWSIVVSYQLGHSLIPPIACIVVTVLLSGVAARAGRVGQEMAEMMRAEQRR